MELSFVGERVTTVAVTRFSGFGNTAPTPLSKGFREASCDWSVVRPARTKMGVAAGVADKKLFSIGGEDFVRHADGHANDLARLDHGHNLVTVWVSS